jgi:hypothetical protein
MIAFAAEHSRVTGKTINLDQFIQEVKSEKALVEN